jgi:hypothetical protein
MVMSGIRLLDIRHTGVVVTFEVSLDALKKIVEGLDVGEFKYHGEGRQKECVEYLTKEFYEQMKQLVERIEKG